MCVCACVRMCARVCACTRSARVCVCVCARTSIWVRTNLPLSTGGVSSHPPYALALPSQPSTSPRLVSNDFPPSYPDSGTHPWGTASPFPSCTSSSSTPFRAPPPASFHRRHPDSGKPALPRETKPDRRDVERKFSRRISRTQVVGSSVA